MAKEYEATIAERKREVRPPRRCPIEPVVKGTERAAVAVASHEGARRLASQVRLRGRTIEERDSKISELETRVEALNEGRQVRPHHIQRRLHGLRLEAGPRS